MQTLLGSDRWRVAMFCSLAVLFLAIGLIPESVAETVSASSHTARASATIAAAPLVVEDSPFGLADGLVRELRNGGYALYLRHGAVLPGQSDKIGAGEWWKDCQNTQRIGPEGQAQVRAIAEALTRQRIVISEVLSSEFCRAFDTAGLLGLSGPQRNTALNDITAFPEKSRIPGSIPSSFALQKTAIEQLIVKPIPPRSNRVLVGHLLPPGLGHPALASLQESHTAIFKVEPGNRFHYITTLSPGQWQWIGKQTVSELVTVITSPPPQVTVTPAPLPNIPLIDAAKELKGAALLQALRKGGFNLYMRHAISTVGQDGNLIQTPLWWENCAIQRNMADAGREQASKVGAAIRELKIPISQLMTAQFCRTRDTGHAMGLGPIEITEDLNHQIGQRAGFDVNAARFKQLGEIPAKGTNRLLVSHTHGSAKPQERIMSGIQEAEIVVFLPDGKGGTEPMARIPVAEWDNLIKADAPLKQ